MGRSTLMTVDEVEKQHCDACNSGMTLCKCEYIEGESREDWDKRVAEVRFERANAINKELEAFNRFNREGGAENYERMQKAHIASVSSLRKFVSILASHEAVGKKE